MTLEIDAETCRRARWKKAQQARRQRLSDGGKVQYRAWVTPDEAAWLKESLRKRRISGESANERRARLQKLLVMRRRADASSRVGSVDVAVDGTADGAADAVPGVRRLQL